MQTIKLYRFTRPDGGVTTSPVKPDTEYTELSRMVADEGYLLTDGDTVTIGTDTDNPEVWQEIPDTENPDEATAEDYRAALREMGVQV